MTTTLLLYHALIWLGLSTMLLDDWGLVAFAVYNFMMPSGALAIWFSYRRQLPAPDIGPYPGAARQVLPGMTFAVAIPLAIFGTLWILGWATDIQHDTNLGSLISAILVPQMFVAAIEEFVFRGVTQPALSARLGPRRGLAATALLFGVFHIPNALYQDVTPVLIPLTIGTLTLMGWVLGQAYRRTGRRLLLPIALHYGWNVASFSVEDLLHYDTNGPHWLAGSPAWFPESGILGTIGLVVLGLVVIRLLPDKHPNHYQHGTGKVGP